jgi:TolA-binding protein
VRSIRRIARAIAVVFLLTSPVMAQQAESNPASSPPSNQVSEGLRFAHGLFRQRKFDLAAEEYQRFLDSGPSGADADIARFGLASARLFQGRYKEARAAFQSFLEKAPHDPRARTARYRLGELAYMLGDLPESRKSLEQFVQGPANHPNLESGWTYLGDVCLGMEDLVPARKAYERVLNQFPRGQMADRARYGLGRTLAGLGESEGAVKVLRDLARSKAADWSDRAWLQIGKIQLAEGHFEEAVTSFHSLEQEVPRSGLIPEARLLQAEALSRMNRFEEAEKRLVPLTGSGDEALAPRASLALATLQLTRSRTDQALKLLAETIKRFPDSPLVPALRFRSAEALQKLNRLDQARQAFLQVAQGAPKDPWAADALVRAARLALDQGDDRSALELCLLFEKQFPDSNQLAPLRLVKARALRVARRPGEAVAVLEAVLGVGEAEKSRGENPPSGKLSPADELAARYELALAYRAAGQEARAESILSGLAVSSKEMVGADARFLIGQKRVEEGKYAEAIEPLTQYLSASPQGDVAEHALAHLATAQLGSGHPDDAWRTLDTLAKQFPNSQALAATRVRMAEAALDSNQPARAVEQFQRVLDTAGARGPTDATIKTGEDSLDLSLRQRVEAGLGRALWKDGKPADAVKILAHYLEAWPDSPRAPSVALDHAGAMAASGQTDGALAAYAALAQRYPQSDEALRAKLARARLLSQSGHPDEAAELLEKILSDAGSSSKFKAIGETRDALLAEEGWTLIDARKPEQADRVFTTLMRDHPDSPHVLEARFNLAESANQAGNYAEVVRLLSPAVEKKGEVPAGVERLMPLILYRLGRAQVGLGDWKAAEAVLRRLIQEHSDAPHGREARFLCAEAALRQGRAAVAEPLLAALASGPTNSDDPPGFIGLVRGRHVQSLVALKRWKEALAEAEALEKELRKDDPAIAELEFARGRSLLGLGRPEDARTALQAVIKARQGGDLAAQAHLLRGETFFHEDRFGEALREFLQVDVLYDAPRWQAAALLEAGKVYERLGQSKEAAETYEQSLSRLPEGPHAAEARARLGALRPQDNASGAAKADSKSKVF